MKTAALFLAALMLTGCNSPGVIKPLPFPDAMPKKCSDGHWRVRNAFSWEDPCAGIGVVRL